VKTIKTILSLIILYLLVNAAYAGTTGYNFNLAVNDANTTIPLSLSISSGSVTGGFYYSGLSANGNKITSNSKVNFSIPNSAFSADVFAKNRDGNSINVGSFNAALNSNDTLGFVFTPISNNDFICFYPATGKNPLSPTISSDTYAYSTSLQCQTAFGPLPPTKPTDHQITINVTGSGWHLTNNSESTIEADWPNTALKGGVMQLSYVSSSDSYNVTFEGYDNSLNEFSGKTEPFDLNLSNSSDNDSATLPAYITDDSGTYSLTLKSNQIPGGGTCKVDSSSINGDSTTINVVCTTPPPPTAHQITINVAGNGWHLTGNSESTITANWPHNAIPSNEMKLSYVTAGSSNNYQISFDGYDKVLDSLSNAQTGVFNLNLSNSSGDNDSASFPAYITDNSGTYTLTLTQNQTPDKGTCKVDSSSINGDNTTINVTCSPSPITTYEYDVEIPSVKVGDATLSFSEPSLQTSAAWANNIIVPSRSTPPYTISFETSDATYNADSGDFNLKIPVSVSSSENANPPVLGNIVLDISKKAGSDTPVATVNNNAFYLKSGSDVYACSVQPVTARVSGTNTYDMTLRPTCTTDPDYTTYTYSISLPSGYTTDAAKANFSVSSSFSGISKSISLANSGDNTLSLVLKTPGSAFTSADSGYIFVKVPITDSNGKTGDAYIYLNKTTTGSVLVSNQSSVIIDPSPSPVTDATCSWSASSINTNGSLSINCGSGQSIPNAYNIKVTYGKLSNAFAANPYLTGSDVPASATGTLFSITNKMSDSRVYIPNFTHSLTGDFTVEIPVAVTNLPKSQPYPYLKIPMTISDGEFHIPASPSGGFVLDPKAPNPSVCTWSAVNTTASTSDIPTLNVSCT